MRRSLLVVLLALIPVSVQATPKGKVPPKLVVQDVEPRGEAGAGAAAALSSAVCSAFAKAKRFSVLCGDDLRALLKFAAMAQSLDACKGEACLGAASAALNARFLIGAKLAKTKEGLHVLTLTAFDASESKVVDRAEIEALDVDRLQADVPEVAGTLLKALRRRRASP